MRSAFTFRTSLLGLASWFIPFAVSVFFFNRTGQLLVVFQIDHGDRRRRVGRSTACGGVSAVDVSPASSLALGCYWLVINLLLDLAVLVALMKMPLALYLYDIGLRYLLIPIISAGMGIVAAHARSAE